MCRASEWRSRQWILALRQSLLLRLQDVLAVMECVAPHSKAAGNLCPGFGGAEVRTTCCPLLLCTFVNDAAVRVHAVPAVASGTCDVLGDFYS